MDNIYPPPIFTPQTPTQPVTPPSNPPTPPPPMSSIVPPQMPPIPTMSAMMGEPPKKSSTGLLVFLIILLFLVIVGGISAFAYTQKIGPFKPKYYSEQTFLPSILAKVYEVTSGSSKVSVNLNVGPRDADAKPLVVNKPDAELLKKYENDYKRASNLGAVVRALNNHKNQKTNTSKKYPESLSVLTAKSPSLDIKDPVTKADYKYEMTENGENFSLTVDFETEQAIPRIKEYGSDDTEIDIVGTTAVFSKKSPSYFYLSSRPPQTFLEGVESSLTLMPSEINVTGQVSVLSEWGKDKLTEWLLNVNGEGSFGDLSYKINGDGMKKAENYYFKINNIPSLFFLSEVAAYKGQWFRISLDDIKKSTGLSMFGDIFKELEKSEEYNKKFKEFWYKVVEIAGAKQVLYFKTLPRQEKVNGVNLTRYELGVKKETLIPFFEKVADELKKEPDLKVFDSEIEDMIEALKSQEFDDIFKYVDENAKFIVWVNSLGYPVLMRESFRMVPPEGLVQFEGKQVNLVFETSLTDINKPVEITAPAESESLIELFEKSFGEANTKSSDARTKASVSAIRAQSEIVAELNTGNYGKKSFALGKCQKTADTLFGDGTVFDFITSAAGGDASLATCVSKVGGGIASSYAVSVPLTSDSKLSWCVDSLGSSKQITGAIKSDKCE